VFLFIAISLGFLGSFHCIGMCGPIALAIPVKGNSYVSLFISALLYNSGRGITYCILGFMFGFLGRGVAIAGYQNILSVSLGVILLSFLLVSALKIRGFNTSKGFIVLEKLKSKIRVLFGIRSYRSLLLIGVLNGLLPCGLVYLGVAGSLATMDPWKGALFMGAFGVGTFPAMLLVSAARNFIGIRFRENIRKLVPLVVGMMAVLLILRGMNLGIPYISPLLENEGNKPK
jgi:sulfite exporter TauE/SafE